jgi:hypothetical protein
MSFPVQQGSNLISRLKGDIALVHDFVSNTHAQIGKYTF